ncbi:MAG: bifunctional phosphopantothenoylcysteine decarboxylase/phosphopantothenate--cysteine ligase CoaBC [Chitinophagales bacterium]
MYLRGKKILLGVCGGIAAYKSAYLVRLLAKEGAEVKVVMTPEAKDFVGALTFSTLSKNPVASQFYNTSDGSWNNHVELGLWGELFVIAPATANTIAKMANGICDNVLLATYLSSKCPVLFAPAMDIDMWKHPSTIRNLEKLRAFSNKIIQPGIGELASGMVGEGRMAEPEEILEEIKKFLASQPKLFHGKKVLITAGPTYEKIDPVRFIGNYSSGKMGFELAQAFAEEGAEVTIVHGPVQVDVNAYEPIKKLAVESADEMYTTCKSNIDEQDIFIAAAAVSDFSPETQASEKIKKSVEIEGGFSIRLKKNKDILSEMSRNKKAGQLMVGFALETENEVENAKKKLKEKSLDLIVLNSLRDKGAGFQHDTNKITLLDKHNNTITFELQTKRDAARSIVQHIYTLSNA